MPVKTRSSKKTTFLDLNDDCKTGIIKAYLLSTKHKVTTIQWDSSTSEPVVEVLWPTDRNHLILAIPGIRHLYDRLANLLQVYDIRVESSRLTTVSTRTDVVPFASIRYLNIAIDFRDHASCDYDRDNKIRAQLPRIASFIEQFPALIDLQLFFKAHHDAFDSGTHTRALRSHLLFSFIRTIKYPPKLVSIRTFFTTVDVDAVSRRQVLVSSSHSMRERKQGRWKSDLKGYKDFFNDEELVDLAKQSGMMTSSQHRKAERDRNEAELKDFLASGQQADV